MSYTLALSFRDGVALEQHDAQFFLRSNYGLVPFLYPLSLGMQQVLACLSHDHATEDELIEIILTHDGEWSLATLFYYLDQFRAQHVLADTYIWQETALITVMPMMPDFTLPVVDVSETQQYALSRFAYLHQHQQQLILESPLSPVLLVLRDWRLSALVHQMVAGQNMADVLADAFDLPSDFVGRFFQLLVSYQLLTPVNEDILSDVRRKHLAEDEDEALCQWAFKDLLFHTRSRFGRHSWPVGKTFPFNGRFDPLPAVKENPHADALAIPLHQPNIESLKEHDMTLTKALEDRRTLRVQDHEQPITLIQLGEFLYRVARVKERIPINAHSKYETSRRPYPSGGATYDLDIYLAVHACEGLPSGLYYYQPEEHQLYQVSERTTALDAILANAVYATLSTATPQIVCCLTSRMARISWSYEGLAYAIALKNVGVLYQTMYLVATAMGLAPCGVGNGNSDLFAQISGINYYAESAVGEFLLGSVLSSPVKNGEQDA